ncbi:hypothetical protein [Chryseobacterium sp.]|uniref:hypothetical protein n=1 Tax=Chryseobacterium sp. TaxID=1871047 RepID=UPI0011C95AFF|nr:hypothetical protein [Chryseobacterium sp.]TXF75941.1 hypothetical protein FUA25_08540 [Chryseobacterium sp.]
MKNYLKRILLFITFLTFCSCLHPKDHNGNVKNAYYETYNVAGEKGYKVYFETSGNDAAPKAVVLNNLRRDITKYDGAERSYQLNIISESSNIAGFRAERSDLENGIIFVKDGKEYFQPVNFVLK